MAAAVYAPTVEEVCATNVHSVRGVAIYISRCNSDGTTNIYQCFDFYDTCTNK